MDKVMRALAAALAVLGLLMGAPRQRRDAGRLLPRRAPQDAAGRIGIDVATLARVASLWSERGAGLCRVPTLYAAAPAAQFAPVLRLSAAGAAPQRVGGGALAWVARQAVEASTATDAELAGQLLRVERGYSPVVRILRAAALKPPRARWDDRGTQRRRAA